MTAAAAFDAVAPTYDRELTEHQLGRWLRRRVHERLAARFPAGSRLLELGCGTGEDAVHLAARGVRVTATDISGGMLEQARRKVRDAGVADRVELRQLDLESLARDDLQGLASAPFDGAFSNFGAVNCVRDRHRLGAALAALVRPGGHLVLVPMARLCLFETLFHLLRGRPRVATRRFRDGRPARTGGGETRVYYPSPRAWARALSPAFEMASCHGLGLLLPPTDLRHLVSRFPSLFRGLETLDRRLCRLPGAGRLADHFMLELRRRS